MAQNIKYNTVTLISDGTALNTKVVDSNKKDIPNIKSLDFSIGVDNMIGTLNVELLSPIVEVSNVEASYYDIYLSDDITIEQLEHFKKCIENRIEELKD